MEPKWNVKLAEATMKRIANGINGTKVECKVISDSVFVFWLPVLMEPKWNVKSYNSAGPSRTHSVLMEPKWNVKPVSRLKIKTLFFVLMEPKWNVKILGNAVYGVVRGINGTKVECKGRILDWIPTKFFVLMEPKWNVKEGLVALITSYKAY